MHGGLGRFGTDRVPQPVLISPVKDTADITGKDSLEFKWSSHESANGFRKYYDFRLYAGTNWVQSALIYKEQVDSQQYMKSLPANMFENGKTYTWTLRQVYDVSRKSDRSYNTFKVIK